FGRGRGRGDDTLTITLTVEALVVEGAPKRLELHPEEDLPPLAPLAKTESKRKYGDLSKKDIFFGPSQSFEMRARRSEFEKDNAPFIHLVSIIRDGKKVTALLYDRLNNEKTKLETASGYDSFPLLRDSDYNLVFRAILVDIQHRDVLFRVQVNADVLFDDEFTKKIVALDIRGAPAAVAKFCGGPAALCQSWRLPRWLAEVQDGGRVYRIDRDYWESLRKDEAVKVESDRRGGNLFRFRSNLLQGKILKTTDLEVFIQVEKDSANAVFAIHSGYSLEDALKKPLSETERIEFGLEPRKEAKDK